MPVSTQVFPLLNIRTIMPPWLSIHQIVFFRSWLHIKCHLVKVMSVFMSSPRLKHFIYRALVKPSQYPRCHHRVTWAVGFTSIKHVGCEILMKYLCTYILKPSTFCYMYCVCNQLMQHSVEWYVSHTNNAVAAAVEASWVGFLCQRRSFSAGRWMIEEKGMGRKVCMHTQTQWPHFERAENRF